MSKSLSLREMYEQRVSVAAKGRDQSGSAVALVLRMDQDMGLTRPADVARLLAHHGLGTRKAHEAVIRLTQGVPAPVELPSVSDAALLTATLAELGVRGYRSPAPKPVDITEVRERLGVTQREFSIRYGIELGNLRNWEQERSPQDTQTRLLMRIIARHPGIVDDVIEEMAAES